MPFSRALFELVVLKAPLRVSVGAPHGPEENQPPHKGAAIEIVRSCDCYYVLKQWLSGDLFRSLAKPMSFPVA